MYARPAAQQPAAAKNTDQQKYPSAKDIRLCARGLFVLQAISNFSLYVLQSPYFRYGSFAIRSDKIQSSSASVLLAPRFADAAELARQNHERLFRKK